MGQTWALVTDKSAEDITNKELIQVNWERIIKFEKIN